ncbi:MAG: hypothetical protein ACTSUO_05970 [Candidatus Thorarchaeota archaeon]
MSDVRDRKEFHDLQFHLWRIKDERRGEWREDIYLMGKEDVLKTLVESLQGMSSMFQTYGKGNRKYKCNPPEEFDHVTYGKDHGVEIHWLDMLIVKLSHDAKDDTQYSLKNEIVTIQVNPKTLNQFIESINKYLNQTTRYGHGSNAVCGLWFSPDWLGAE